MTTGPPTTRRDAVGPAAGCWRRPAVVGIKAVHSAIFLVNSASVIHVCWAGLADRPSRWTRLALAATLTESAVFLANRGRCPLTDLVESLGAEHGRVSDIFLPRWFADRIPQLCAPPLAVGVLALTLNAWRHRRAVGSRRPRRERRSSASAAYAPSRRRSTEAARAGRPEIHVPATREIRVFTRGTARSERG